MKTNLAEPTHHFRSHKTPTTHLTLSITFLPFPPPPIRSNSLWKAVELWVCRWRVFVSKKETCFDRHAHTRVDMYSTFLYDKVFSYDKLIEREARIFTHFKTVQVKYNFLLIEFTLCDLMIYVKQIKAQSIYTEKKNHKLSQLKSSQSHISTPHSSLIHCTLIDLIN